jgi:hypothetical protein
MIRRTLVFAAVLGLGAAGCDQSEFGSEVPDEPPPDGIGTPEWGESDVLCDGDDDCNNGESCRDGVCQVKRCTDSTYQSVAPLGTSATFFNDREVVVADFTPYQGQYYTDGYGPNGTAMSYSGSWTAGSGKILDVAGGNLTGQRPDIVALQIENSSSIALPALSATLAVGFVPRALAAGDVDGDGMDEVVVLGPTGQVSICHINERRCERSDQSSVTGIDVAVADIDADGFDEPILHLSVGGVNVIRVLNLDAAITGQAPVVESTTDGFISITAGDVNGDRRAEVLGLQDGGWLGWATDRVQMFSVTNAVTRIGQVDVIAGSLDLSADDLDRDKKDEILLLSGDRLVEVYRSPNATNLTRAFSATLSGSSNPQRIATVDFDGDSPTARRVVGPILVPGEVVPTVVMHLPPYYQRQGEGRSQVWLGNSESSGETLSRSVSLDVGVTIGLEADFSALFSAEVSVHVETGASRGHSFSTHTSVSSNYYVAANPELYGQDYAAVVLSCGCFHSYTYQIEAPGTTDDGRRFAVLMPVGGQTNLWSSRRYNAMAAALGLPEVATPYRVGDPSSYPTTLQQVDGGAIANADNVFPSLPSMRVSDVGELGWSISAGQYETNDVAMTTSLGVEGSVGVAGFSVGGNVDLSWTQGYEISVGSDLEMGGWIPPLVDDPTTPEDEYAAYSYQFKPAVYREHYDRGDGTSGAYYVVTYAVGP